MTSQSITVTANDGFTFQIPYDEVFTGFLASL